MKWLISIIGLISIGCGSVITADMPDESGVGGSAGEMMMGTAGSAGTTMATLDAGIDMFVAPEVKPIETIKPVEQNLVGYYTGSGIRNYIQLKFAVDPNNFDKKTFTGTYMTSNRTFQDQGVWSITVDKLNITLTNIADMLTIDIIIKSDNTVVIPGYNKL